MCEINKKDEEQIALLSDLLASTLTRGFVKEMREDKLKDKDPDANNFIIKITSLVLDLPEMEAPKVIEAVDNIHRSEEETIFFMKSMISLYMLRENIILNKTKQ